MKIMGSKIFPTVGLNGIWPFIEANSTEKKKKVIYFQVIHDRNGS